MGSVQTLHPDGDPRPHMIEAEQQVLGALLLNNDLLFRDGARLLPEDFYDPVHGWIYAHIVSRVDEGQLASPVTLKSVMENHEGLKELGGAGYLVNLAGAATSLYALPEYCQIIRDMAAKRRLLDEMDQARDDVFTGADPASTIAQRLETAAGALLATSESKPLVRSHLSSLTGALNQINDAYQGQAPLGVSTGLRQLDDKLNNLRPTNLIILGGRPGMAKTTGAQNIAFHAARNNTGVFFASLEMSGEELAMRFLSKGLAERGTEIPYSRMLKGQVSEREMRHVVDESMAQQAMPLIIGERDVRQISRLRSAARRAQQKLSDTACPLGLIVVDYVQRVDTDKPMPIRERVTAVTDALKSMAMDFNVPVLAMAQLSRAVEARDNKRPMLSDLKESGSLEEDADVVMFFYRHAYYLQKELSALRGSGDVEQEADLRAALARHEKDLEIIIGKQRSGAEGTINAFIDPGLCHITQDRSQDAEALI